MSIDLHADEYMAMAVGLRIQSSCVRRQVGAIIASKTTGEVVGWGWNKEPPDAERCDAGGCPRGQVGFDVIPRGVGYTDAAHPCVAIHAEEMAVLHAASLMVGTGLSSWSDCHIFVTSEPCANCRRFLYGVGFNVGDITWRSEEKTTGKEDRDGASAGSV